MTPAPLTLPRDLHAANARRFPADFLFGAATAAYQIEGAAHEDGRTDSIWDAFSRVPGAVLRGENGDTACDHYHRYRDDVALMKRLGLQSYRFSTSWSRVQPDGGAVNPKGIDFYSRLVDELLEADITPWLTLYHWDLPQALEEQGGWTSRDTAARFRDYALHVHDALGDRVDVWTTLNEPWCSSFLSYTGGVHAPGRQSPRDGLAAGHHLLLGHGLTVEALRARDPGLELGITLNLTVAKPVDPARPGDVDAARRIDGQFNRFFLDPIFRGSYPEDLLHDVAAFGLTDVIEDGDLARISQPIDALGVNYYHGQLLGDRPAEHPPMTEAPTGRQTRSPFPAADGVHHHSQGLPRTGMGWEVQPDGLRELLVRVNSEYAAPAGTAIYVTENGSAFDDVVAGDGSVPDARRTEFLESHLGAVLDAIDEGVDVRGYFYWSLMDNYEWAWGYSKRFGIVRVDYDTQKRTVKDSGLAYAKIIHDRALGQAGSRGRS
ncbi:beta-glucosidase [Cryobacterium sp. MP_M5]|uniref:GH1 family beta-glucosidase n=1 Tax=unclassified Cryobacterium TaxID=2649013 RepID=UPI0018CB3B4A|nr:MULTISPECIES: GH1 family beta-glucosidase [unclassified Cryobacterium]MBG6059251.1 beta-glucosidase [Cryobacterium sp. MP_M3]MEC5177545.1 beta-glucosidase [Cryobacterium sp. MP_M5]